MAMKPVTGKLRKGGGKGLSGDALVGKVSQSTIDSIKKMGMTEALKLAGKNNKTSGGLAREFQEGVRRMYGADRLTAAKSKYGKPVAAKPSTVSRPPVTKPKTSTAPRPPVATKASGATPAQKDMYGNKVKSNVTISATKKSATKNGAASKKTGYKAGTQKDLYGNKIN